MMATTISNSISENPLFFFFMDELQPASVLGLTIMAVYVVAVHEPFFGASPKVTLRRLRPEICQGI
jgi:hypothetical protein